MSQLLRKSLPWLFLLSAIYMIGHTASQATGKRGLLELWVMWMSSAKVTRLSAIIFGLAGVAYGLAQRSLRRSVEARLAQLEARTPPPANPS